jgi:S-adenosylmethionine synthetase
MMFGYATTETENYMPLALDLSHRILQELADLRRELTDIPYLRPDAKAQVTIEYSDDNVPQRIDSIVVSTQHDDFSENDEEMLAKIKSDIVGILIPRVVAKLAKNLQRDKIETILDQTHHSFGDQLPEFMEISIRENDFVLKS